MAPTPLAPGARGAIDEHLARQGLTRNIVVRCPHFGLIPAMVSQSLLVLTTGRQYCQRFLQALPVAIVEPPLAFPRLLYYQLWHDCTHGSPAAQWLRQTIREGPRAWPIRRPTAKPRYHPHLRAAAIRPARP